MDTTSISALKIYDLENLEKNPRKYWEGMKSIYFQNPNQFIAKIANSPLYGFIEEFIPDKGF